ncbi:hypothetical protein HDU67_009625 [Dinochytrium kinnereticum]|nr:hypothetical protein HDU67_009625 [Dinochytrium kinnereticum]
MRYFPVTLSALLLLSTSMKGYPIPKVDHVEGWEPSPEEEEGNGIVKMSGWVDDDETELNLGGWSDGFTSPPTTLRNVQLAIPDRKLNLQAPTTTVAPAVLPVTISVKGVATDYESCGDLREGVAVACGSVPAFREDGGADRASCLDENVKVSDECVTAFDEGATSWIYEFNFAY